MQVLHETSIKDIMLFDGRKLDRSKDAILWWKPLTLLKEALEKAEQDQNVTILAGDISQQQQQQIIELLNFSNEFKTAMQKYTNAQKQQSHKPSNFSTQVKHLFQAAGYTLIPSKKRKRQNQKRPQDVYDMKLDRQMLSDKKEITVLALALSSTLAGNYNKQFQWREAG
jgi:hypothetical protein